MQRRRASGVVAAARARATKVMTTVLNLLQTLSCDLDISCLEQYVIDLRGAMRDLTNLLPCES